MFATDIIAKKRDGLALTRAEIEWFIEGYVNGQLPDYQAAALLMAICINGMNREEIIDLTLAMANSGHQMDLADLTDYAVDKHSSGGVGDKTTLVVLPLVAACGVLVAKMSGRGLGFSGGTLDKLESIAGYRVNLSEQEFREIAKRHHIVLAGQSKELAPADGLLYALRDVTATVPSLPLIASSIMSKKIAAGANGIVLDVKTGIGSFMPELEDARALAQMMARIGVDAGRDVVALLSDMNQPLGCAVGNALEVAEAIATLQDRGPQDFREHCLVVASYMLKLAGRGKKWVTVDEARGDLELRLRSGGAFEKFRALVQAQGGDVAMVDDPSKLPVAQYIETVTTLESGYIQRAAADKIGMASLRLGAGRARKEDVVDLAVGLQIHCKVGDKVQAGDPLATIHANDPHRLDMAKADLSDAIQISPEPVKPLPLFYDVIEERARG